MTLPKADLRIIAQDRPLPGLALLLDNTALLASLRQLPALQDAQSVTVAYLRYKPGTSCAASLVVTPGSGRQKTYFAKALTVERFTRALQHPKRQALIASGDAQALHEHAILLQSPLHDRTLRCLQQLKDDEARHFLFRQLLPDFPTPERIEWRLLRYKPERRSVILLSCQDKPLAVLRCASEKEYARMLQGTTVGTALGHVALTGTVAGQRMLATRWIDGESLGPEQGNGLNIRSLKDAGSTLAHLHNTNTPFPLPHKRSTSDNIQALWRVQNILAAIAPHSAGRFHALAIPVAQSLLACQSSPVLIHGDFSADQLVKPADGGPLRIIDWDRCDYGSPLVDLASFQARLDMQVIQKVIQRTTANIAMSAFLRSYSASRPAPVDKRALRGYSAWALLCLATEPFRNRAINWPAQITALLDRVQLWVTQATTPLPQEDLLTQLRIPSAMTAPLVQALNLPPQSQILACHLLRHKPARRAIIEYQLTVPIAEHPLEVLGKYSAKGVNNAAFRYQQILWQHGWDDTAAFCVPEPLAVLPTWNLWLQRKVNARALTERLVPEEPQLACLGKQVGKALATLHQHHILQQAVKEKTWHLNDELAVLQQGLQKVAALYPHWQARLTLLLDACQKAGMLLNWDKTTCVHRDFYPDQVLVNTGQQITLLDFDLCCTSAPALDAGNYLAHIREWALRRYDDIHRLHRHEQAFIHAFLADSPDLDVQTIEVFTTLSLARHIYLSTQFADRYHTTEKLLTLCEDKLQPCAADHP